MPKVNRRQSHASPTSRINRGSTPLPLEQATSRIRTLLLIVRHNPCQMMRFHSASALCRLFGEKSLAETKQRTFRPTAADKQRHERCTMRAL